jgi:fatty-acyl-CoA synthase
MVSTDTVFKTLILGGTVIVVDGFQPDQLADLIATESLGRLTLMPGMIAPLLAAMRAKEARVKSVKWVGVMADLVPLDQIAEVTTLFQAPYLNTFGATETGFAPASAGHIGIGDIATSLDKQQSALCQIKLVDAQDQEVPEGETGELAIRSPALFSGYWNNPKANAEDFRNGWFHMGDMFKRGSDGGLRFVDRRKYLIKSGGENIYPAEIERLILADPRVLEAAVVRQKHHHWGEVPIAFIARKDASLSEADILAHLCTALARYKLPKAFHFIAEFEFPRSTTGKIMRHVLEQRLG